MRVCVVCCVSRYSAGAQANILWSAGVKDKGEVGQVLSRLEEAGMPTLDISGMDAARVRHGTRQLLLQNTHVPERMQPFSSPIRNMRHSTGNTSRSKYSGSSAVLPHRTCTPVLYQHV